MAEQPAKQPEQDSIKKFCQLCGEYFSEEIDPNHREVCRDRNKP
ncbi:MAG: hypothetical protein V4510_09655 [bacterium]